MSKIVRVTMEYDDGFIGELTGEIAEKWLEAANSCIGISWVHGLPFPEFTWGEVQPSAKLALVRILAAHVEKEKSQP